MSFIKNIINEDLLCNIDKSNLRFRFPPEPNGYLHLGHAKAIFINFNLARYYNGKFILRFDDTNPVNEKNYFIDYIKKDISWLGCIWDEEHYTSDYFDILYQWAVKLILKGLAYVDHQSQHEINDQRRNPTIQGIISPYRDRSIQENLSLFTDMRLGRFKEGECVLRAKIDMNSSNMHFRDPVMYRILYKRHNRTGYNWKIYPTYDWAHGQSDYIEQISHSLCSIEFQNHKILYNWYLNLIYSQGIKPIQIEFSRLNVTYMLMSKRVLTLLVNNNIVTGWDDPRMPTISGLRRKGFTPESISTFCNTIGVSKREKLINFSLLELCARKHLYSISIKVMVVFKPVKIIISNYEENKYEYIYVTDHIKNCPVNRKIIFSKYLYIEREDFQENPSNDFFRLCLDGYVRLKYSYIIKAYKIVKNCLGQINQIFCLYYEDDNKLLNNIKVRSTIHWVSSVYFIPITVKIYQQVFNISNPAKYIKNNDYKDIINNNSLKIVSAYAEKFLINATRKYHYQFIRKGYYYLDKDSTSNNLIFNRTVKLKNSHRAIN
jgi:glutaminyl-tRNA synthetase